MADKDINNQYDLFREVRIDVNGYLIVSIVTQTGVLTPTEDANDFYKKIALNENGELKIII